MIDYFNDQFCLNPPKIFKKMIIDCTLKIMDGTKTTLVGTLPQISLMKGMFHTRMIKKQPPIY